MYISNYWSRLNKNDAVLCSLYFIIYWLYNNFMEMIVSEAEGVVKQYIE